MLRCNFLKLCLCQLVKIWKFQKTLQDRSCKPQLQELHVLKLENMNSDSKTDTLESFLVTIQTNVMKTHTDPDAPAVAPIGPLQQMLLLNKLGFTKIQRVAQT